MDAPHPQSPSGLAKNAADKSTEMEVEQRLPGAEGRNRRVGSQCLVGTELGLVTMRNSGDGW